MPSQLHDTLLSLFRNRPELAPELLREALHLQLPAYTEARIESAEFTDVQPTEYRADLVVLLYNARPVLGVVVEAQLGMDIRKRFAWPLYCVNLRARIRCPVHVLVVTPYERIARWASKPIALGGHNYFSPLVLGPSGVPIVTDPRRAKADPELAVLSAMAHGRTQPPETAEHIALAALAASLGLDAERSTLYVDLVLHSLGEAARKSLQAMDPAKYEYQSEFAKRYHSQGKKGRAEGKAEGEARGRAAFLLKVLRLKYAKHTPLPEAVIARVQSATIEELDQWTERVLDASSLSDVLR